MKTLLVRLSALGDVVMTLPLAADLARAGHEVHWLVNAEYAPLVDEVTAVKQSWPWRGLAEAPPLLHRLRAEQFDLVLDAQGLFKSALPAKLAGGRKLVGLALTREPVAWLYGEKIAAAGWDEHALLRYRRLGAAAGADASAGPEYGVVGTDRKSVRDRLAALCPGPGRLLVVNPHARWQSKRWLLPAWSELLRRFPDARRVVIGSAAEQDAAQALAAAVPGVVSAAGQFDLPGLWTVIGLADAVVTTDSAAQHIAAAQNRPLVVLFGPTDPRRTGPGPYARRARVLHAAAGFCPAQPCFRRTCPESRCLGAIAVDDVAQAVRAALEG